jgi:hypothetical protein
MTRGRLGTRVRTPRRTESASMKTERISAKGERIDRHWRDVLSPYRAVRLECGEVLLEGRETLSPHQAALHEGRAVIQPHRRVLSLFRDDRSAFVEDVSGSRSARHATTKTLPSEQSPSCCIRGIPPDERRSRREDASRLRGRAPGRWSMVEFVVGGRGRVRRRARGRGRGCGRCRCRCRCQQQSYAPTLRCAGTPRLATISRASFGSVSG